LGDVKAREAEVSLRACSMQRVAYAYSEDSSALPFHCNEGISFMRSFPRQPIRRVEHSVLKAPNAKMWSHAIPMLALPKDRPLFVEDDEGGEF
jgi:hypothetical protein